MIVSIGQFMKIGLWFQRKRARVDNYAISKKRRIKMSQGVKLWLIWDFMMNSFVKSIKENYLISLVTFVVAFCSIVYELVYSQMLTVIFGGTVLRYSITIGLFLFSLGLGSLTYKYLKQEYGVVNFLVVEMLLSVIGPAGVVFIVLLNSGVENLSYHVLLGLSYVPIMLVGFLSGLEIPILAQFMKTEQAFADTLGVDYFGSLVGTVVYAVYMYPIFGLVSVAIFIGFLNIFTAVVVFGNKYYEVKYKKFYYSGAALMFAMLFVLISHNQIHEYISQKYLTHGILESYDRRGVGVKDVEIKEYFTTPYQEVTKYNIEFEGPSIVGDDLCINLDNHLQMCESWVDAYHYAMVDVPMSVINGDDLEVLIVGGGDFIGVEFFRKFDVRLANIDQVDIDEKFVEFAKNDQFILSHNNKAFLYEKLNLMIEDAYLYLKNNKKKYDLVILDLPGLEHDKLAHLASKEFYTFINRSLSDERLLVSWVYEKGEHRKQSEVLMNTVLAAGFEKYYLYPAFKVGPRGGIFIIDRFNMYSKGNEPMMNEENSEYTRYFGEFYREDYGWEEIERTDNVAINSVFRPNYDIITR